MTKNWDRAGYITCIAPYLGDPTAAREGRESSSQSLRNHKACDLYRHLTKLKDTNASSFYVPAAVTRVGTLLIPTPLLTLPAAEILKPLPLAEIRDGKAIRNSHHPRVHPSREFPHPREIRRFLMRPKRAILDQLQPELVLRRSVC